MSYIKKHKEGLLLTILFHVGLLLILLKFGFFTALPLPEDKGVLVDFGVSDAGMGKIEPTIKPTPIPEQQPEETQEQVTPPPTPETQPNLPEPEISSGNEEVMTQDFEETAAIEAGKKKQEEEELKRKEEARKKKEELEKKLKEEKEKQRIQEIARKEREAIEKRRKDSIQKIEDARLAEQRRIAEIKRQDSIRRAQEQAKIDAINKRAQNVFGGSSGSENSNSESEGQGATYESGNQGTATGSAGANKYGLGGGEGISYNMSGRSAESLPKPTYPGQEEGTVVVQVTVDKYGKVTKAEPGVKGTTTSDMSLRNAAKNAALTARFNEDSNAPAFQTGTITYRFVLN
ncbi:MAG: hypothetical protein PF541_01730 [Prolixibacteraceae bacterium]|nr:hypothetical protein [Prolixibacteraceae bacterium]